MVLTSVTSWSTSTHMSSRGENLPSTQLHDNTMTIHYNTWQHMTTHETQWQHMTTQWQYMTTHDNTWQHMTTNLTRHWQSAVKQLLNQTTSSVSRHLYCPATGITNNETFLYKIKLYCYKHCNKYYEKCLLCMTIYLAASPTACSPKGHMTVTW